MPLLRRPYTGPYDHERRRAWPAALGALTALLVAGLIGWAIGNAGGSGTTTRTVTHTVTTAMAPSSVYEHTRAGAVAAAEANLVQAETSCVGGGPCQSPAAYSLGPDGGGLWSLAYRIKSYTPTTPSSRRGSLGSRRVGPDRRELAWQLADVPVTWTGTAGRRSVRCPRTRADPHRPRTNQQAANSQSFARVIASFWRFPGAP